MVAPLKPTDEKPRTLDYARPASREQHTFDFWRNDSCDEAPTLIDRNPLLARAVFRWFMLLVFVVGLTSLVYFIRFPRGL